MKNRNLLWWGLGAGTVAVAAYILGWLFFWPTSTREYGVPGGYGYGQDGMMGMMGGYGSSTAYGPGGMMGGSGGGMMGGMIGMMGGGMMDGPVDTSTSPLSLDQAQGAANRYLDYWGNSDLKVTEVIEFTNGFYARVNEQSTGAGAFELLVGRNTGVASPEPGAGMAWNTKYGPMGTDAGSGTNSVAGPGMMGGYGAGMMGGRSNQSRASTTTDMPVKKNDARDRAQKFLDKQLPGTKAGEPDTFYGYFTVEVEKDGKTFGMLSVDGYYGQIWYHSWHGAYLSSKQF